MMSEEEIGKAARERRLQLHHTGNVHYKTVTSCGLPSEAAEAIETPSL